MSSLQFTALFALVCLALDENQVEGTRSEVQRCFPDEWEGNLWQTIYYYDKVSKTHGIIEQSLKYARSFPKNVGAGEGYDESSKAHFKIIQDFNELIQYTIYDDKCLKSSLYANMGIQCLPDVNHVGKFYQGAGDHKLNLNVFAIGIPRKMKMRMSLTEDGVLLGNVQTMKSNGLDVFMNQVFSNVVLNVTDPSIFDVPDICDNAEELTGIWTQIASMYGMEDASGGSSLRPGILGSAYFLGVFFTIFSIQMGGFSKEPI